VARGSTYDLANHIEHSWLDPLATPEQIRNLCAQAERYRFPAVCVLPGWVPLAVECLHGGKVKVCTVIGFPTGAHTTATKLYEACEACDRGAAELDVALNLGWLKAGNSEAVYQELAQICEETGAAIKAILEGSLLTDDEKRLATEIAMDAGAAFIKTSTGWRGGVTLEDVRLLHEVTQGRIGIKAASGIGTADWAIALIEAGATRLGTSRGPEILQQPVASERENN